MQDIIEVLSYIPYMGKIITSLQPFPSCGSSISDRFELFRKKSFQKSQEEIDYPSCSR
jgi:hypothetical protein